MSSRKRPELKCFSLMYLLSFWKLFTHTSMHTHTHRSECFKMVPSAAMKSVLPSFCCIDHSYDSQKGEACISEMTQQWFTFSSEPGFSGCEITIGSCLILSQTISPPSPLGLSLFWLEAALQGIQWRFATRYSFLIGNAKDWKVGMQSWCSAIESWLLHKHTAYAVRGYSIGLAPAFRWPLGNLAQVAP